jgi:hypothetical protein
LRARGARHACRAPLSSPCPGHVRATRSRWPCPDTRHSPRGGMQAGRAAHPCTARIIHRVRDLF